MGHSSSNLGSGGEDRGWIVIRSLWNNGVLWSKASSNLILCNGEEKMKLKKDVVFRQTKLFALAKLVGVFQAGGSRKAEGKRIV